MTRRHCLLLTIAAALLAVANLSFAQDAPTDAAVPAPADATPADPVDHFATDGQPPANRAATLELRGDATLYGNEIHLRQLCRWSDTDAPVFTPVADLTLARFGRGHASKTISLDELRDLLQGANVNVGSIRFSGAVRCKVTRSDASTAVDDDARAALEQWAKQAAPASGSATLASAQIAPTAPTPAALPIDGSARTLRQKLLNDLAQRLNLSADDLEVSFDPRDSGLLNLSEPNFTFDVRARHVHELGDVRWDVTLTAAGDPAAGSAASQRVTVNATARAWQDQLTLARPVAYKEVFRDDDVEEHRVLVDTLPDAPVLPKSQVVGQEAGRDLQTGTVITARVVEPVPLAKTGQVHHRHAEHRLDPDPHGGQGAGVGLVRASDQAAERRHQRRVRGDAGRPATGDHGHGFHGRPHLHRRRQLTLSLPSHS